MMGPLNSVSDLPALRASQLSRMAMNRALHRLASSTRINQAADDPVGLMASASLQATLAALNAETAANERAINVATTADAGLGEISGLLTQAKALQSANADSTLSDTERQANQLEIDSILSSVDRIAGSTNFLGQKLLDGTGAVGASGQRIAIDSAATGSIGNSSIDSTDYTLADLRSGGALDSAGGNSEAAGQVLDAAINDVATIRGSLGAFSKNTLQPRLNGIAASRAHMMAAISMIQDADYAVESSAAIRSELLNATSNLLLQHPHQQKGCLLDIKA